MLWNVHGLESAFHLLETKSTQESTQHDILMLIEAWTSPDIQPPEIERERDIHYVHSASNGL